MLNKNDYSADTAMAWEKEVFIRNIKSFNKAIGKNYHTLLDKTEDYNNDLIDEINAVYKKYPKLIPLKADYLAERSIPDNIS